MRCLIFSLCFFCLTACSQYLFYADTANEKAASINIQLGVAYLNANDLPRAKQKFSQALKQAPYYFEAYEAMGLYYDKSKQAILAKAYYQKAIALSPRSGQAHNTYATFLCRQHEYEAAMKEFDLAITDPHYTNTAKALENASLCAKAQGHQAQAKQYLERAFNEDPSLKKDAQAP